MILTLKASRSLPLLLLLLLGVVEQCSGFRFLPVIATKNIHSTSVTRSIESTVLYSSSSSDSNIPPAPDAEKARLTLDIAGTTVNNALFRAELKKELTFFRGCSATFQKVTPESAQVVAEGKTAQLLKFLKWLSTKSLDASQRKPSFEKPPLQATVLYAEWSSFVGDMKGFTSSDAPPELGPNGMAVDGSELMDASSMAGTDESVP